MRRNHPGHRRALRGAVVIVVLAFAAACGSFGGPDEERWAVVQDYLDRQAAWEERAGDIRSILLTGAGSLEQRLRGAEEAHGAMPDATAAVDAARAIVAAGGPRTVEAAEFLIERWRNPAAVRPEMGNAAVEAGPDAAAVGARLRTSEDRTWTALIAHVGPDWSVVQGYVDDRSEWWRRVSEGVVDGAQDGTPRESAGDRPSAIRAVAAARAILAAGGEHARTVEAAEFLASEDWSTGPGDDRHLVAGARALLEHAPDFDGWPDVLRALDRGRYGGDSEPIGAFLEDVAASAEDPALRAAARYYVASGLMRRINDPFQVLPEDWAALRERAVEAATGLSAGVENEPFAASVGGTPQAASTFAEVEAELVATIRHATVGGTLPELTGRRLDGREEPLSAYRGRVLLIDFWATWCVPCIVALPELRALVADLPADRFALLAVSVDEELAAVTELLEREPMPWDNWHVGTGSAIERALAVRGFPTYVLVDQEGVILSNGFGPLPRLRCMAERAVTGEDPYGCTPADWMPGLAGQNRSSTPSRINLPPRIDSGRPRFDP